MVSAVAAFFADKMKLVTNEKEITFLKGYTLHILTDIFNCQLLYAPNLIRYDFKVDEMRDEYRRECILQDNFLYKIMPTVRTGIYRRARNGICNRF